MVDFWEVFGRILTNDDFRRDLYDKCPDTFYKVKVEVSGFGNKGLDIAPDHYKTAREIVAGVVTDGPVSLNSLGEMLMILSSKDFRNLLDVLAETIQETVNTQHGSKLFYTAVGLMMLDGQVFGGFADGFFDDFQFHGLSGVERDALTTLANNNDVLAAAGKACNVFWDVACSDEFAYYPAQGESVNPFKNLRTNRHMHPIVQPYPPDIPHEDEKK